MKKTNPNNRYLFNVDILVEAETNGEALERLLAILNKSGALDYRIQSGIELGQVIEDAVKQSDRKVPIPVNEKPKMKSDTLPNVKPAASAGTSADKKKTSVPIDAELVLERIQNYIATNRLIRLIVNKGRGVKLSVPCRIISFDTSAFTITAYHVDEKQVYTFTLNEIDDFIE